MLQERITGTPDFFTCCTWDVFQCGKPYRFDVASTTRRKTKKESYPSFSTLLVETCTSSRLLFLRLIARRIGNGDGDFVATQGGVSLCGGVTSPVT
jgi:hypothetical protein